MRLLTTDNLQLTTRRKGFTLMEILIAASIFAGVMIMTTGVLAQSSSFRGKIRATRETSEDTKRIADMITRDVREANASIDVVAIPVGPGSKTFKSGIVLLNCKVESSHCKFSYSDSPYSNSNGYFSESDPATTLADTLVIAKKDGYIMYVQNGASLYRKTYTSYTPSINADSQYADVVASSNIISSNSLDTSIYFAGYTPDAANISNLQQPYVQFYIVSETKDYDTLSPNARSKMEIRSSVTARNFAN